MKSWLRLFLVVAIVQFAYPSSAQWIPAAGMEGAPCDRPYLIDSNLVMNSGPAGIFTRHVDSANWEQKFHLNMMGYTVAGECIMVHLYNSFFRSFDLGETWDTLELFSLQSPMYLTSIDTILFVYDY